MLHSSENNHHHHHPSLVALLFRRGQTGPLSRRQLPAASVKSFNQFYYHNLRPQKQRTDLAPRALKQTSLTINTPRSSTTRSLSSSTSKRHPPSVIDAIPSCRFARATRVPRHHLSRALLRTTPSHSHSLAITTCYSLSPSLFEPHPPFIVDTTPSVRIIRVMLVPRHPLSLATFAHPSSRTHTSDIHMWVRTRRAWAHVQTPAHSRPVSQFSYIYSNIRVLVRARRFAHVGHGLAFNPTRHTPARSRLFSQRFASPFSMSRNRRRGRLD